MKKMSWMIDEMNKGKYIYRLRGSMKSKGTVCMPTADGKSGVMIEDIVYLILNSKKDLIINVSSPILKLNQQLLHDLFEVLELLKVNTDSIRFFINSSDDGNNYSGLDNLNLDANPLSDFNQKHSKINIVASCHKSLYKFVNFMEKTKGDFYSVNYLDESHLLPLTTQVTNGEDEDAIDANVRVDLDKLCKLCNQVFAFSATPDDDVTNTLLKYEPTSMGKIKYAIHVKARESIQAGRILPPMVKYLRTKEVQLTVDNLKWVMTDAKLSNDKINHKILVTCNSKSQMRFLTTELENAGYKVFSICSPENGYEDFEHENIKEFSNMVETYEGDCFVLHIKMLIAGIDIKGLTDCVLFSRDHGNKEKYRRIIQTIGRVLRCLPGERGKEFVGTPTRKYKDSPRKKPYGGVYFISPIDDPSVENQIRGLIERYYGLECVAFERAKVIDKGGAQEIDWVQTGTEYPDATPTFTTINGIDIDNNTPEQIASQDPELCKLMMNIESTLKARYERILRIPGRNNRQAYEAIKRECDAGLVQIPGNYDTVEWLTDTSITDFIYEKIPQLFEDVLGFETYIWQSLID